MGDNDKGYAIELTENEHDLLWAALRVYERDFERRNRGLGAPVIERERRMVDAVRDKLRSARLARYRR
ncbi:MAG: hypothetical protein F9K40_12080 [Kofleriaceae bacterium]|nr:MAG: hypothetical protein F9K40_12080 [Kofleriaceae bacterium]